MPKAGRLLFRWSNREKDYLTSFPRSCDGHWLNGLLNFLEDSETGRTVIEELEARGYDPKTIRFQCDRRADVATQAKVRS